MLVLSLIFSSYSYARYVSRSDVESGGVGTAKIDCGFTVNGGGGNDSFINAPFMQKVTDNTQPVRMNSYSESVVTVSNYGKPSGLKYEFGFVFYLPKEFAEHAMFQLVELKTPESGREDDAAERLTDAKKASALLSLDPATLKLYNVVQTADGVKIENDYAELINSGGELGIDTDSPCAVLQDKIYSVSITDTFATYRTDDNGAEHFVAPVSVSVPAELQFYRITVNLSYTSDPYEYVLTGGASKSFLFRLVLREARDSAIFENTVWDPAFLWETSENDDGTVSFIRPERLPDVENEYACRWATDGGGWEFDASGKPVLEIKENAAGEWYKVNARDCVGLTSPAKLAVVFTQRA